MVYVRFMVVWLCLMFCSPNVIMPLQPLPYLTYERDKTFDFVCVFDCLMTPGVSKIFCVMYGNIRGFFLHVCVEIKKSDIRPE